MKRLSERGTMPKEIVLYPSYTDEHPLGLGLSLHWGQDGTVQWCFNFNVRPLSDHLTKLTKDSPGDARSVVFTEPLTRPDLQRTIRAARRARDAAYGSDE